MIICLNFKIYSFVLCILLLIELNESKTNNECEDRKFEDSLNALFSSIGVKNNKWPENEREVNNWCKSTKKDLIFVKNYAKKCLNGHSRPVLSAFASTSSRYMRSVCKSKQEKNNYLAKGKCGNRAKDDTAKCWSEMIIISTNIKKLKNPTEKHPTLCCALQQLIDCWHNTFKRLGSKVCTKTDIQHMDRQIDRVWGDSFNIMCNVYEDRDKCVKFNKNFDKSKISSKNTTPFLAAFEILESI